MKRGIHNFLGVFILGAWSIHCIPVFCEDKLTNTEAELEKAKSNFKQRFLEFTGDKNVMGKASTFDGKIVKAGSKTKFNRDDGESYKSDLTYHDFAFKTPDESAAKKNPNDPKSKDRELMFFISPHGGLSEAGGSSQLERTVYQEHERESQNQEKDPEKIKQMEEKEGVKYQSIFRIHTQEVVDKNKNGGKSNNNHFNTEPEEKDKVERVKIVDEVKQKIEKVGEDSFQTIEESAKDTESKNDPETLGNPIFYYEAASRAAGAWWDSTLANLSQRRMYKGVVGAFDESPQVSEDAARCEDWANQVIQELQKNKASKASIEQKQQELQRMVDQCKKMAKVKYNVVNPRFEDENGKELQDPQAQGEKTEDALSRDLRNQLEVLSKAGISSSKLQSNWKYDASDDKAKVTIDYDEKANPSGQGEQTVKEQIEDYNNQLDEAAKGFQTVKEAFPDLKFNEKSLGQYKIEPEKESVKDIMQRPVQQELEEELGKAGPVSEEPENYDELVNQSQKN